MSFDLPSPGASPRRAQALVFLIEEEAARTRDVRDATVLTGMPGDVPVDLSSLLDETAMNLPAPVGDDLANLGGYALARRPNSEIDGRTLERTASVWAPLVPDNAHLQAQTLLLLLQRHAVVASSSPRFREALGADTPAVREAFESLGQGPLSTHYAEPRGLQKLVAKFRRSHTEDVP